jgi:hypothetical protein
MKRFMGLRRLTENENGRICLYKHISSRRHSRARGNPGLLHRISLDTRFRGYDGIQAAAYLSHPTGIFKEEHEGREEYDHFGRGDS